MNTIKVKNQRQGGSLFHYAHFICDCLFPEVLHDVYKFDRVLRLKNLNQTLGNFGKIYEKIFDCLNVEMNKAKFNNVDYREQVIERLPSHENPQDFKKFVNFIFMSLSLKGEPDPSYPEVLLIKRGERMQLISDPYLKKQNKNITNGKERREIIGIERAEKRLSEKYGDKFEAIVLEDMAFEDQVLYFYNAKVIVCAHGACMANLFFCQPKTIVIEVNAQTLEDKKMGAGHYPFFDTICRVLNLNQKKIEKNNAFDLLNHIDCL